MVTAVPGLRGTGEFSADFRPTNYRELYTFLEPNGDAPLNALLAMMGSEATDDPKFNNFRDEMPTRVFTVNGAVADTSTGTITLATVADAGWVVTGTLLVNAATGELMRATADGNTSTGVITVTRNVGSTTSQIADGATLFIAGSAFEEGSSSGNVVTFDQTVDYNYTQIFKTPLKLTGTLQNTALRTGDKEDELRVKALKMHMSDIERAFLFSRRAEVNGSSEKIRYTGGLTTTLTQTIDVDTFSSPGVMDEDAWDRKLIDTVFAYGSKTKTAFVGTTIAGHLLAFGKNRWSPQSVDGAYGIKFTRYTTPAGDLLVYLHPQFRQLSHMADAMVILDTDYIRYRYLQNRDTDLQENIQNNDEDAVKHQYLTEAGLELMQNKVHTYVTNWSAVSA
jgi:hypothetical protein